MTGICSVWNLIFVVIGQWKQILTFVGCTSLLITAIETKSADMHRNEYNNNNKNNNDNNNHHHHLYFRI